ncbi:MAG: hypothetical protein ABI345_10950 [Jatrophihabitans sp.]
MTTSRALVDADRATLAELTPVVRRAVALDARSVVRFRFDAHRATVLVRLPFGVLVSRSVEVDDSGDDAAGDPTGGPVDVALGAADALAWLDDDDSPPPAARDADWRSGLPPHLGWQRVETVPDDVVRPLVRSGALALKDAAAREGVPGAHPRAEVADALLDAVVLTVRDDAGAQAEITLRALSALTRMGFLPKGGLTHIDVSGRWVRIVAGYGTVYLERPGSGLLLH